DAAQPGRRHRCAEPAGGPGRLPAGRAGRLGRGGRGRGLAGRLALTGQPVGRPVRLSARARPRTGVSRKRLAIRTGGTKASPDPGGVRGGGGGMKKTPPPARSTEKRAGSCRSAMDGRECMWPFSSSTKQDARVREAWGKFPWVGLEGHYEHIKRKGALRGWAKKVAARAEAGKTPVIISVGADYGVARDPTT